MSIEVDYPWKYVSATLSDSKKQIIDHELLLDVEGSDECDAGTIDIRTSVFDLTMIANACWADTILTVMFMLESREPPYMKSGKRFSYDLGLDSQCVHVTEFICITVRYRKMNCIFYDFHN